MYKQKPYYSWESYSTEGKRVSDQKGLLKLVLNDKVAYRNVANQITPYFTTNSIGYRGPELGPYPLGKKRVIMIGGSAAFGTGLASDAETVTQQMESLLTNSEVVNAAVIGHTSAEELNVLFYELLDLKPDVVISLGGANDSGLIGRSTQNDNWFHQIIQRRLERLHQFSYPVFSDRPYNIFFAAFPTIDKVLSESRTNVSASRTPYLTPEIVARDYVSNVLRMNQLAQIFGFRFLCVLQLFRGGMTEDSDFAASNPKVYQPDSDSNRNYEAFRSLVVPELNNSRVEVLDLNRANKHFPNEMFMDQFHLDSKGNSQMAELIVQKIGPWISKE